MRSRTILSDRIRWPKHEGEASEDYAATAESAKVGNTVALKSSCLQSNMAESRADMTIDGLPDDELRPAMLPRPVKCEK